MIIEATHWIGRGIMECCFMRGPRLELIIILSHLLLGSNTVMRRFMQKVASHFIMGVMHEFVYLSIMLFRV